MPPPLTPRQVIHEPASSPPPLITPSSASPVKNRRLRANSQANARAGLSRPVLHASRIQRSRRRSHPNANAGAGAPPPRPDQMSPLSTDTSSDEEVEDNEDDRTASSESSSSDSGGADNIFDDCEESESEDVVASAAMSRVVVNGDLVVVELGDSDTDTGELPVLRPNHIEYADSDRSRSHSRHAPELDRGMMTGIRDLNCDTESDASDLAETDYERFILKQREEKRRKRMSSGSIGKRTITESIGSDSDREDLGAWLEANDVGSSARRLRRKVGDRRSLLFQDPPPPRIDELEEPDSSDEDMRVEDTDFEFLARELPYYTYVSMEVDSP